MNLSEIARVGTLAAALSGPAATPYPASDTSRLDNQTIKSSARSEHIQAQAPQAASTSTTQIQPDAVLSETVKFIIAGLPADPIPKVADVSQKLDQIAKGSKGPSKLELVLEIQLKAMSPEDRESLAKAIVGQVEHGAEIAKLKMYSSICRRQVRDLIAAIASPPHYVPDNGVADLLVNRQRARVDYLLQALKLEEPLKPLAEFEKRVENGMKFNYLVNRP